MNIGSIENHRSREAGNLVYPVYSRRSRGLSLGINLFPKQKVCSFDCPYCEVFPFKNDAEFSLPLMEAALTQAIEKAGRDGVPVRDICFSGNGEPTLSPHFTKALQKAAGIRSVAAPSAALVLITNGTGLLNDAVFNFLKDAAAGPMALNIWLKVDAGTEDWYRKINFMPNTAFEAAAIPPVNYADLTEKLRGFCSVSPVIIQSMCCAGDGSPPPPEENSAWESLVLDLAKSGNIKSLQLYGKARPAPNDPLAAPLPIEYLEKRAASLRKKLSSARFPGFPVEVFP
jgi:histidinol dehydrogenase